ncbi:hypothetical protein B0O99DRAFT_721342 [Bisporella sp. PMI_857]|nr:hypothetical protein B0O99DRAFT_721342 [Bisporella sp. PMI_857]
MRGVFIFAPKTNENKNWIETDSKTSTGVISGTVWGDGLPVWHQQSDLTLFAAASSTSSSISSSSTITTSSSSISPSSTSVPATTSPSISGAATQTADAANRGKDNGDGGLSTGGIIAICIVIPATVMVAAIFGFYFYYTRKKRRLAEQGIGEQNIAAAEKYNNGGVTEQRPLELGTFPPSPYQSPYLHHSYTSQTAPQEIGDRHYEANYPPVLTPLPRSG